jgi:uncharacterized protein YidB (DUF937 family)
MAKSMPSLLALLGLVAVAGYQNRSKIGDMLTNARQQQPGLVSEPGGGPAESSSDIDGMFHSGAAGSTVSSGLADLIDRFNATGQGKMAGSWVANGANQPLPQQDLERALGEDTLAELVVKTGLTRADLLHRLASALPDAVHQLTPDGRLPSASGTQQLA